ncbi:GvpL/GvpF family gas vesicle protein [Micromonospora avicenniae]|uniref:Gas vesicle synthesis protein GvpL/GvpF n=1 Tax=Micromonospora avicenniae TaxID=1198245 RepID=A0A1N6QT73_9ACTN|nr:GvpL/GvpF family gas vesicle protein [Micromonospora avicenniae]SIQ19830.1 Gas vesicle synthesis protein GvpL/GvpF [Micromonospora avicenniae]
MSSTVDSRSGAAGAGRWLHGVVREADLGLLSTVPGMTGEPVRPVRADGLVAVVSTVPLTEYGEEALRRNLEDLGWLEQAARAHHRVVDALAGTGAVVPARLATVHRDDDAVTASLTGRRSELVALLDGLAGRGEWGVKGYLVPGVASRAAETAGPGGVGTAYLRRRRAQLAAREDAQRDAAHVAATVHEALARRAVVARRHPPQDRRLSGVAATMALNGAYLVDVGAQADFARLVEALAERHPELRLELTGPWPPYSFVTERPVAAGDDAPLGDVDAPAVLREPAPAGESTSEAASDRDAAVVRESPSDLDAAVVRKSPSDLDAAVVRESASDPGAAVVRGPAW